MAKIGFTINNPIIEMIDTLCDKKYRKQLTWRKAEKEEDLDLYPYPDTDPDLVKSLSDRIRQFRNRKTWVFFNNWK